MPKAIKTFETIFVVEGTGEFPIDMLRYDSAMPVSESDSARIASRHLGTPPFGKRRVALVSRRVNNSQPTEGRWASFGWHVIRICDERADAERVCEEQS